MWLMVLFLGLSYLAHAQQPTISGTVKDTQGKALAGVTIHIKNTAEKTQTNLDGHFPIAAKEGDILVFSLTGMQSQEQTVKGTTLNVVLLSEAEAQKPKGEGVASTNMRGATSITGTAKPLWVVDGVILDDDVPLDPGALSSSDAKTLLASALGGLSADDISGFRVLKDASATAIYGPRAIAGVIEVTTRKGSKGSSSISYTNESTYRLIPMYSDFNIMNSQEQMDLYMEMMRRGWFSYEQLVGSDKAGEMWRMYYQINSAAPDGSFLLKNTPEAKGEYLRRASLRNTNWFNRLFQSSIMQQHSVSLSTGTDKASYYASVSVLSDPGWMKYSKQDRYSGNLNANYKLHKNWTLNVNVNGEYREKHTPGDIDPLTDKVKSSMDLNPYSYAMNASRMLDPKARYPYRYTLMNIFEEFENNYSDMNVADIRLRAKL